MFISLEGIEGCGKTTQARRLASYLQHRGRDCLLTREPGGTAIGGQIRRILLSPDHAAMDPAVELLLYVADRVQHVRETIRPALRAGRIVVCDRFVDATLVYQGFARGLPLDWIRSLHRLFLEDLYPDVTFLLDLPPAVGLQRAWRELENGARIDFESRFEREALTFHQRVRAGYLEMACAESGRFFVIDAAAEPDSVHQRIVELLNTRL